MVQEPLVSIVTPVYNRPGGIVESSYSVINQTYQNWELIVVDDASTDETAETIDSSQDFRIKPFHLEKNVGPQFAYKEGIKRAKGKYVFFHDSDDIMLPDKLEKCVEFLENHKDVDVLYHGVYRTIPHQVIPILVWTYSHALPFDAARFKKEQYIPGISVFRREILDNFTPHPGAQGSWDWFCLLQLMFAGAKFAPLDEGLEIYQRHDKGLAVQHENSGRREESFAFIRKYVRSASRMGRTS